MGILNAIWTFFATYILQKPPYMVGFLTLLGYCLMGKKWYDVPSLQGSKTDSI